MYQLWLLLQDFKSKNDPATYHRDNVTKVYCTPGIDKYISCSRDGTMRSVRNSQHQSPRVIPVMHLQQHSTASMQLLCDLAII